MTAAGDGEKVAVAEGFAPSSACLDATASP